MSNTIAAWQVIFARYVADTGSGGLNNASAPLITGMYLELAPESQSYPYVVFSVQDDTEDDTQGSNRSVISYVFNLYTDKELDPGSSAAPVLVRLKSLYHRWKPSLSGYTFETSQRRGGRILQTPDDAWHFTDEYTLGISKDI